MFWGYFYIILSATSFGLIPIFATYAYESGISTSTLLFLRFAFASIILFAYLFLKVKKWKITKRQLVFLILLGGILYSIQSTLYFTAVKYIPASLAALLLYLYPIFVAILSFFVNKEKLSKKIVLAIALSIVGIILVLGSPKGHISLIGILFASAAAVVYSIYIVIGDRVTKQISPMLTCAFISLFSAASLFMGGIFTHTLSFHFGKIGWVMAVCVAFFCSVVAMFTFFAGMNIIGPTKASILSMVEPVVTFILSTILFQEKMSVLQLIGGIVVLLGAILVVLAREKGQHNDNVIQSQIS
ncbi:EamA family transporter [Neobacillus sp. PS3-40]|uniref:DMT family transporter n=1 Tax=Neobacillus sp. PS3-40 TaxID=3070679 RepID=UPI0027DF5D6F|nr:EamA family transporter [Neobacillus sp. PS3-40]WML42826.1 EamA family transporter [Neobacillus sp. PS3-40]